VAASLQVAGNPGLDWLFSSHFRGDPVMPGSLGL
jgi:3-hydroxymyristoyl/3-hydroxydecanoyl-(acyl carrier protein) dehydratase